MWSDCECLGYSGHVQISDNADRLGEYSLWHKPKPGSAIYERLLNFQVTSFENEQGLGGGVSNTFHDLPPNCINVSFSVSGEVQVLSEMYAEPWIHCSVSTGLAVSVVCVRCI